MRETESTGDVQCVDRGVADVAYLLVRIHVWSVDHGPRETYRTLVSRASELGSASSCPGMKLGTHAYSKNGWVSLCIKMREQCA